MATEPEPVTEGDATSDPFRGGPLGGRGGRGSAMRRFRGEADVLTAVALGGGLGSLARYAVAVGLPTQPGGFPWSTFLVNVVGCVLIGVLLVFVTDVWRPGRYARPFLAIGVLGGFTTYSTMMLDLRTLGAGGDWLLADAYLVSSLVAGLAGIWFGVVATRLLTGLPVRRRRAHGR